MIDLYTWTTPNGRKVSILLEELGVAYKAHAVDLSSGAQKAPEFLAVSPNGKIPAIRERESGRTVMESGAIMLWLAERKGRFLGAEDDRASVLEWLMWQMSAQGPVLGTCHQVLHYGRSLGAAGDAKFLAERDRLYGVLDARLSGRDYVAGAVRGVYTIADMAIWPWVSRFEWHQVDMRSYPAVADWYLRIADRPAVVRGYDVPGKVGDIPRP